MATAVLFFRFQHLNEPVVGFQLVFQLFKVEDDDFSRVDLEPLPHALKYGLELAKALVDAKAFSDKGIRLLKSDSELSFKPSRNLLAL
jgi:hypothetical protein